MPNSPRGAPQGARFPQRILLRGSNIARVGSHEPGKPNSLYDTGQQSAKVFSEKILFSTNLRKIFPAKLSRYTVFYIVYWPEEQAASLVGRDVVVSPDAVTTGYNAQVCVGQANYPDI